MSKKIVIGETGVMLIRNIGIFVATFHLFVMVVFLSGKYQIHGAFLFIMGIVVIATAPMLMQSDKVDIVEKNDSGLIGSLTLILLYYLIKEIEIQQTALVIYIGYVMITLYQIYGENKLGKNDKKNQSGQPKLTKERLNKILKDYGKFIEENPGGGGVEIFDVSVLPHPKEDILTALLTAIALTNDDKMLNTYKNLAIFLSDYQENVGAESISALGINPFEYNKNDMDNIMAKIAENDFDKYESYKEISDKDLELNILPKIKLAEDIRNKKDYK